MEIDHSQSASIVYDSIEINASGQKVWEVISTPGNLNSCHPFCKENEVIRWGDATSKDMIEYYNGLKLYREFVDWNDGNGYSLLIGRGTWAMAKVIWKVTSTEQRISNLSITITLFPGIALKRYPRLLRRAISKFYLLPHMKRYVNSVLKGFQYYIETGSPVQKNQFGYNRMFSTAN